MTDAFERAANKELLRERRMGFWIHFAVYIGVNLLLFAIWAVNYAANPRAVFPWFIFPLLGWGIGIAAHGVGTWMSVRSLKRPDGQAP